jgi:Ser/Thr protein kinase RdoA (MazF antagonist)
MTNPALLFLNWANQAVRFYNLRRPAITFLGHSENITFQIHEQSTHEQFLLRLHCPCTHTFVCMRQQPDAIHSELCWLNALAHDTDISVPQPIRNSHGALVTELQLSEDEILPCTLLCWVDGDPFHTDGPAAETYAAALGRLLATLHDHAQAWDIPNDFVRPSYDSTFFRQVADNLQLGVIAGVIEPTDYHVIQQTIEASISILAEFACTRETWGVIHNDLHPGNCLVAHDAVCPIDFSLCGFGYFLFDVGTSMGSLNVSLRQPLLEAYYRQRDVPDNAIRLIEAFFIISRMSSYGFALPNPDQHTWLQRRIPQVVETICQSFLRGETFLFAAR